MKINAFCTADSVVAKNNCDKLFYCGNDSACVKANGIVVYKPFCDGASGDIYLTDLFDEDIFTAACDHIVTTGAHALVRTAYDLNEAGIIEAKYKLSPIMLLHKMGVLGNCTIAGGVCLDNDDLDLMAQEGVDLVITPTASAGYGHGFAPVCAALRRDIKVGVGTFDGKYNKNHDLNRELEFLRLTANAEMRVENALSESDINKILDFA